jgi:hypothetical protein
VKATKRAEADKKAGIDRRLVDMSAAEKRAIERREREKKEAEKRRYAAALLAAATAVAAGGYYLPTDRHASTGLRPTAHTLVSASATYQDAADGAGM